jgi:DNA-directed RNA polymerase specialized sigma subunit
MGKTVVQTWDPTYLELGYAGGRAHARPPETPIQALLEADLFEEPRESSLEHELKVEGLRDALDNALDDRERWVIESIFYRRRGIRLLAQELSLSKTHIARIRDAAYRKIADYMQAQGTAPGGTDQ